EHLAGAGVRGEVEIALAVPALDVLEPRALVRPRPAGLGEQLEAVHEDRQLTGTRRHHLAPGPHPVADAQAEELLETVAEARRLGKELDLAAPVAQVGECHLAMAAGRLDAPGDAVDLARRGTRLERAVLGGQLSGRRGPVEPERRAVRGGRHCARTGGGGP